jgi:hypothetical protein
MNASHLDWGVPLPFRRCPCDPIRSHSGRARLPLAGFIANQYCSGTCRQGMADREGWSEGADLNVQKGPILDEGDT